MILALSALIIALCSLMWNIFSTLHSWRANAPSVTIELGSLHVHDSLQFRINLQNQGAAAIAVTSIDIWTKWDSKGTRSGRNVSPETDDRFGKVTGPKLPFTINGYHSQIWYADSEFMEMVIHSGREDRSGELMVEAELATGKTVNAKYRTSDYVEFKEYLENPELE